jgi:hypothetical protein
LSIVRTAPYSDGSNPFSRRGWRHFVVVSPAQAVLHLGGSSSCPAKIVGVTHRASVVVFRMKTYHGPCTTDLVVSEVEVTLNQPVFASKAEAIEIVSPPGRPEQLTRS